MSGRYEDRGPNAPWTADDGIEYVDHDVLYAEAIDQASTLLADGLEERAQALRDEPSLDAVLVEIRAQMTLAASQGQFGAVRELHDLTLSLFMARESTRRAV